jgi:predicted acylesterase/phospholipase RssA
MDKLIAWSFSGAAARAIALFRMAKVSIEKSDKPNLIIGTSSGALVAPIIAVSYANPELMLEAIKFAETLDILDMFPYKGNKPFKENGKIADGAILRALTHNHLGWQDIKPLYKKVFKEEHFNLLKESNIKCYSFGVRGDNWTPILYCLNEATTLDDMIDMIECSSRIVPFVQPMGYRHIGHVDGGFISFNPGRWLLDSFNLKELILFNSHPVKLGITNQPHWDKDIISVITQAMEGMTNQLAVNDMEIVELKCKAKKVKLTIIEAPDGYTDEVYETDDAQLIALGEASEASALKILI